MEILWRIELLGGLCARETEPAAPRVITRFRTQKTGALLAYLARYRGQKHAREVLIEMLWPEGDRGAGLRNLRQALSSLRHQMEPPGTPAGAILIADRFTVQLNPRTVTTDVAEFEAKLASAARAASTTERTQLLVEAVDIYRGELLPGYYEGWIAPEKERLAGLFFGAIGQLIGHLEQAGDLNRALDFARRAVSVDPLREEAHQDLMRLLAAAGQPAAALRQFHELERLLEQELGEDPSAATLALARQVERQSSSSQTPAAPPTPLAALEPLPTGTVTFLLTDSEDAPSLAQPEREASVARHRALLRRAFRQHGGRLVQEAPAAFTVAFARASDALACAITAQRAVASEVWPVRVRMAIDTREVRAKEGKDPQAVLKPAVRLLLAAHGGQILVSEETAALLRRDLEPGVRLRDLGRYHTHRVPGDLPTPERLFEALYPDMARQDFPPVRAEPAHTPHLPPSLTRFFGREQELAHLQGMLFSGDTRLLTLTGPGGSGKTRLAIEAARRLAGAFAGAVWFVPLADVGEARLLPDWVHTALRLPRAAQVEPLEQVVEALSQQRSLLVLDNLEHLPDKGAALVRTLLTRTPTLTILATSRQVLGLEGEREFVVPVLPTPGGAGTPEWLIQFASVQLFVDRAQAVRPDFQVTGHNAPAVADLCARLEGIPLAIELAAARSQVLTPGQMLAQFAHRFDLLVRHRRDAPERHRSLWAALDWSYRLLSSPLQRFFCRLSVFRGGWTAEAAAAVCEEPLALDHLAELRRCSLVLAEESVPDMRFRMLETLREYADGQLSLEEQGALKRRHRDFFLGLVQSQPKPGEPEHVVYLDRLEAEHGNLRAALEGCEATENGAEAALKLAVGLHRFWSVRGYLTEGRECLKRVLEREGASGRTLARASALHEAGTLAASQGDQVAARALFEEALAIRRDLSDTLGVGVSLHQLANVMTRQGDYAAAQALLEESLARLREIGDRGNFAFSVNALGWIACLQGNYERGRALHAEALAIFREIKDRLGMAVSLNNLGCVARDQREYALARTLFEESLALYRELGHRGGAAGSLDNLGKVALRQEDYASARSLCGEALRTVGEQGDRRKSAESLGSLAALAAAQGGRRLGAERAARLHGAAEALREAIGAPLPLSERAGYERTVSDTRAALGEEAFAAAWGEGRAMTLEQAVAYALEETKGSVEASVQQCVVPPEEVASPTCPSCSSSEHQIKAGFNRGGSQRYQCQRCHRIYTPKKKSQGYSEEVRLEALRLHDQGQSVRRIAQLLGVAPQSVANWIKAHQADLPAR